MRFLSNNITKTLIHLLFWVLFVFISLFVFSNYYWTENPFLQYFFILASIVYFNNGILLPFFIKKKYYFLYVILISAIAFLGTQAYCNFFAQCGCSIMKCLSDYLWQTLVPIVFFSFIWMLFSYLEKEEEVREIKEKNNEMELQFLKSQINPHVLFNNLNTIYSFALEDPKKVPEMILMLSDNLKHVLYESNTTLVSLEKELDYITNYIAFQKIRTENIKEIIFLKNIDSTNYHIAPLLLISLIENAFKHSASKSTITIKIHSENGVLTLDVTNKIAAHTSKNIGTPIGLANLKKRLNLLYKDKHALVISETENYSVQLKLQLT